LIVVDTIGMDVAHEECGSPAASTSDAIYSVDPLIEHSIRHSRSPCHVDGRWLAVDLDQSASSRIAREGRREITIPGHMTAYVARTTQTKSNISGEHLTMGVDCGTSPKMPFFRLALRVERHLVMSPPRGIVLTMIRQGAASSTILEALVRSCLNRSKDCHRHCTWPLRTWIKK